MFRSESASTIKLENFSVGSIIIAGDERYLVYRLHNSHKKVGLLNLQNYVFLAPTIEVADPHWLTHNEAGLLTELLSKNWPRSDFTFDSVGIKKAK